MPPSLYHPCSNSACVICENNNKSGVRVRVLAGCINLSLCMCVHVCMCENAYLCLLQSLQLFGVLCLQALTNGGLAHVLTAHKHQLDPKKTQESNAMRDTSRGQSRKQK